MYSSSYKGQGSHQSSYRTGKTAIHIDLKDTPELRKLYQDNLWRLNPVRKPPRRFPTGIPSVDAWLGGGLPNGLTIFYGDAGTGKSLCARQIAMRAPKALYFAAEVISDAPDSSKHPNVVTIDMTRYIPNWDNVIKLLTAFYVYERPSLIVLDSISTILSITRKAVPEAELRSAVAFIHRAFNRVVPIVGISEIREGGFRTTPAGGYGVKHGCNMLIQFAKVPIRFKSEVELYGLEMGDVIYTATVEKDKDDAADTRNVALVEYDGRSGRYSWISLKEVIRKRKSAAGNAGAWSVPAPAPPPPPAFGQGGAQMGTAQPATTPPPV